MQITSSDFSYWSKLIEKNLPQKMALNSELPVIGINNQDINYFFKKNLNWFKNNKSQDNEAHLLKVYYRGCSIQKNNDNRTEIENIFPVANITKIAFPFIFYIAAKNYFQFYEDALKNGFRKIQEINTFHEENFLLFIAICEEQNTAY
jgi:hypothetical protein